MNEKEKLRAVHEIRMRAHWGKTPDMGAWPASGADWRQSPHGAPWDSNVHMAQWHLKLAQQIKDAGLLS